MRRAPKKFTDTTRSEITPQWSAWHSEKRDEDKERDIDRLLALGQDPATYFPEDYDKDLGEGQWIFVIDPPTSVALDFDVPVLSLWWARPHRLNQGKFAGAAPYQAVITTPAGDLHLWPHEYTPCANPEVYLGEDGTKIHSLGGDPVLDEEKLFYLCSRGISRHDATMLLFGEIRQQNFCYLTFHPELVDIMVGVGTHPSSTVAERWHASRTQDLEATA